MANISIPRTEKQRRFGFQLWMQFVALWTANRVIFWNIEAMKADTYLSLLCRLWQCQSAILTSVDVLAIIAISKTLDIINAY